MRNIIALTLFIFIYSVNSSAGDGAGTMPIADRALEMIFSSAFESSPEVQDQAVDIFEDLQIPHVVTSEAVFVLDPARARVFEMAIESFQEVYDFAWLKGFPMDTTPSEDLYSKMNSIGLFAMPDQGTVVLVNSFGEIVGKAHQARWNLCAQIKCEGY